MIGLYTSDHITACLPLCLPPFCSAVEAEEAEERAELLLREGLVGPDPPPADPMAEAALELAAETAGRWAAALAASEAAEALEHDESARCAGARGVALLLLGRSAEAAAVLDLALAAASVATSLPSAVRPVVWEEVALRGWPGGGCLPVQVPPQAVQELLRCRAVAAAAVGQLEEADRLLASAEGLTDDPTTDLITDGGVWGLPSGLVGCSGLRRRVQDEVAAVAAKADGMALSAAGDWEAAVAAYSRALELATLRVVDVRRVYATRAAAHAVLWHWQAAESDYSAALQLEPDPWAYQGRAVARAEIGADREAAAAVRDRHPVPHALRHCMCVSSLAKRPRGTFLTPGVAPGVFRTCGWRLGWPGRRSPRDGARC